MIKPGVYQKRQKPSCIPSDNPNPYTAVQIEEDPLSVLPLLFFFLLTGSPENLELVSEFPLLTEYVPV